MSKSSCYLRLYTLYLFILQDCIQQTVCHHGASMSGVSPSPPHNPSVRTKGQTCAAAPLGRPVSTQLRCPGAGNLITNIDLSPPCEPVLVSCYPAPHHCPCPSRGYNEDVTGHLIGTGHHTVRPTPCKHTLLEDHVRRGGVHLGRHSVHMGAPQYR